MLKLSLTNKQQETFVPYVLIIALFFTPISASLKSIFIILSAVGILLTPTYRRVLILVFSEHWCKAAIILFLVILIACFWSPASYHTQFIFLDKYTKLLYLPLFAIAFQNSNYRKIGQYVFLFSMTITCIASFILDTGDPTAPGRVFHDHIATGFMMAFAAYLSGLLMIKKSGLKRIFFFLLTLLFSYQLIFINTGRIGYFLYFVLMITLMVQTLSWKYLGAGILCFCAIFSLCAYQSTALSFRLNKAISDLNHYQQGDKITPIGIRLVFHAYAKSLFFSSPLIGHGTGSFSKLYQIYNQSLTQQDHAAEAYGNIMEPHSQYWLIASETGLLGLAALIYFFGALLFAAFNLEEMKPVMLGMLLCFFISNFFDSQLLHSNVGYLFILFCSLCLGELIEKKVVPLKRREAESIPLAVATSA